MSLPGFEALRLSLWGAWKIFGPEAGYVVCVNSLPLAEARARTGDVPEAVVWRSVAHEVPGCLRPHLTAGMAEGVAWKFIPMRIFPDRHELALDNDCILWDEPPALRAWLEEGDPEQCLLAEDVRACFGRFAPLCGSEPRNSGIRGLPPGFDLEAALSDVLRERPGLLVSELDEQGLQVAALSRGRGARVVTTEEVTICSPFPPHQPYLGRCGAHFVGLNVKTVGWEMDGLPAEEHTRRSWERLRGEVEGRVGVRARDPR